MPEIESPLYTRYRETMQKIADVRFSSGLLQWDQETYLPPKGNTIRGNQIATLNEIAHEKFTNDEVGNLLRTLSTESNLSGHQKRNVELTLEDYTKNKKLSPAFVRKMSETVNRSFHSWLAARKENSFSLFEKDLSDMLVLKKEEANLLGYKIHPYNALLNDYEKGCTVAFLDNTFHSIKTPLKTLFDKILQKPEINNSILHQHFNKNKQWLWGMELLKQIGFDFEAGRQDLSEHPFTVNFNACDVRVTTRIDEYDFSNMTWSCIHEAGHALYEQGLPMDQYGLPLGEPCSFSIHESQSRLWENNVGRGLPFWEKYYELLNKFFPDQFANVPLGTFYKAINKVHSTFIRTESDEISYHFHILIRYEIEKGLIEGSITPHDIPAYWNELYKNHLGIVVPDDREGCLQDVHWSHGSFGYFPTYSLGSFYAAQFYEKAEQLDVIKKDNFQLPALLNWLRSNIHLEGRSLTSDDLCRKVTGEGLNVDHFMAYLNRKYSYIYSL